MVLERKEIEDALNAVGEDAGEDAEGVVYECGEVIDLSELLGGRVLVVREIGRSGQMESRSPFT